MSDNGFPALQIFVKALFNYDPRGDEFIPCQQAGLGFERGDILEIVSKTDFNWWQVYIIYNDCRFFFFSVFQRCTLHLTLVFLGSKSVR